MLMKKNLSENKFAIKFLICQKKKAKINECQFTELGFCWNLRTGNEKEQRRGLGQSSDRFSVITFSIFHQFDSEEFHLAKMSSRLLLLPSKGTKNTQTISHLYHLGSWFRQINQKKTKVLSFHDGMKGQEKTGKRLKLTKTREIPLMEKFKLNTSVEWAS